MANDGNLRRGKQPGRRRGAPNATSGFSEEMRTQAAERRAAMAAGEVDPGPTEPAVVQYRRLQRKLGGLLERELDRYQRSLKAPSGALVDLNREFRVTSDRLQALIEAEGASAQLDEWLASLAARLEAIAPKLGTALGMAPPRLPDPGRVLEPADL